MALFTQQTRKDEFSSRAESRVEPSVELDPLPAPVQPVPVRTLDRPPVVLPTGKAAESIVAAGLMIEGKIEGCGNVRVAGRFKGNVNVKGELTIEPGASIDGEVKADTVFVSGEVRGQIVSTSLIEFKESGTLVGDLKAGILTVAAGSKMRGKVEFGWKEGEVEAGGFPDDPR
ncbi:MAG TPA: polymer-forming cytoskeletal protein [Candidatus Methylomirabilis sp.]|nr:polymer-forming cytoskeletal protein [Candidatus Methylomirabilis sp.]